MRNNLKISSSGEDLLSSTDDGTNRLFINGNEIPSANWTGAGNYTTTVQGHAVTIAKVEDATGNVAIRKTGSYTYELYKIKGQQTIDVLNMVYPVGSIYMSVNNVDPSGFIGGTWEQIKDTFLLSAGDTYVAGDTGGEATHVLTVDEIPSHSHTQTTTYSSGSSGWANTWAGSNVNGNPQDTGTRGGGKPHNNMPPYLVVYVWKRTA